MHKGKLTNINPPRITTEPKWLDKSSNEIFSYDWDLSEFDGTRLNSEFVSFLKEGD